MIIVDFELLSANTGKSSTLGIITISNIGQRRQGKKVLADYRVAAFPKGTKRESILVGKVLPHRQAHVFDHPKHSAPVWDLMAKALKALGYASS